MVVVTYNVAVYNEVPPHPCPSDDTNQRHTRVRNHVGVVAFFWVLEKSLIKVSNKMPRQDSKMVIRLILFMPH